MKTNCYEMDGHFEYEGGIIYYRIADDCYASPQTRKGIEKIGLNLFFYNSNKTLVKTKPIWGEYDDLQNISPIDALKYYAE